MSTLMPRTGLTDMDADGVEKYKAIQAAAREIHEQKCKLLEELAFNELARWLVSHQLGAHLIRTTQSSDAILVLFITNYKTCTYL